MQLRKVLDKFDELDGDNENIFFGGDTNIKLGNQRKGAFGDIEQKGYKSVLIFMFIHNLMINYLLKPSFKQLVAIFINCEILKKIKSY